MKELLAKVDPAPAPAVTPYPTPRPVGEPSHLLAKRRGLLTRRKLWFHPETMQAIARRRLLPWLFDSEKAKEMGHRGGCARAAKLHANAARSEVRRKAAFKRWRHRPVKTS